MIAWFQPLKFQYLNPLEGGKGRAGLPVHLLVAGR